VPFHTYKNVYQFTCTQQKLTDTTEILRSSRNCAFWVRNCLHIILQAPRNWRGLLDILKMLWIPDLALCYSLSLSLYLLRPFNLSKTHYKTSRYQISHLYGIGNFKYRQNPTQGHSRLEPKKQKFSITNYFTLPFTAFDVRPPPPTMNTPSKMLI
jgi:hypothetical protein